MDAINPPWAAQTHAGEPPRIAVHFPNPRFGHLGWPKALVLPDGAVLLAFLAGESHSVGGSPAVAISHDEGLTFSEPFVLAEFNTSMEFGHSGNLAIGLAADGAVVVLAMAYSGKNAHIFGWRSADSGKTWSPTNTDALGPRKTGSVFGNLVALPDGRLLAVGHYRPGSEPYEEGIWMAASRDHGRSWESPRRIVEAACVEPLLVRAESGRLILFLRHDVPLDWQGFQSLAWSDDGGRTWEYRPRVFSVGHPGAERLAAPFAWVDPLDPKQLMVLLTTRSLPRWTPGEITLWRGSVEGLDFKKDRALLSIPDVPGDRNTDFGYPWMVPLGANRYRVFYYHGEVHGPNPIWRFDVE